MPPSSSMEWSTTMFGWLRPATVVASRSKRARRSGDDVTSAGSTLIAMSRSRRGSRGAVDLAHPPAPSGATIRYGPRREPANMAIRSIYLNPALFWWRRSWLPARRAGARERSRSTVVLCGSWTGDCGSSIRGSRLDPRRAVVLAGCAGLVLVLSVCPQPGTIAISGGQQRDGARPACRAARAAGGHAPTAWHPGGSRSRWAPSWTRDAPEQYGLVVPMTLKMEPGQTVPADVFQTR